VRSTRESPVEVVQVVERARVETLRRRQGARLGDRRHRHARDQVVAELRGLARAGPADVFWAAERSKQRLGPGEVRRPAADHDRQGRGLGAAGSSCPAATRFLVIGSPIVPRPMNATRAMSLRGRGRELAAELAETRQRPAARRERDPDHDLVRARGVGDPELESLVVRADAVVVLVLDREVDRRAGGAAFLRRGQKRGPFDRVANPVAEAEVVDDRRAVLDLAVEPDECPLAVALRLAVEELERTPRRPPPRCGPGARPCVCPRGGRSRRP
jgi:hypothetical protein